MKKLGYQAIWNTAGNAVYLFALWLLTVITTRLLGYPAAGNLTLAMSVGNIFAIVQMFGVRSFQSSDVTFQYSPGDYLCARCVTVAGGGLLCLAAGLLLGYRGGILGTILLFLLFKTSESFSDVLFGDDQRMNHLELAGYSMLLRGVLTAGLFFAGAFYLRSLNAALLAAAAGVLALSLLYDLPLCRKTVRDCGAASGGIGGVLKNCFPLFLAALIPTAITAVPRILLERSFGAELLGYYGNVSTPALLLTTVVPTILAALLPGYGMSYAAGDYRAIRRTWLLSVLGTLVLSVICFLGALALGRIVLSFVYTKSILPYVRYLYGILIAMTLYALTMCGSAALVSMRESRAVTLSALLALLLCLAVSFPLVHAYGIGGAIAALAIPYGAQALVQAAWILRVCRNGGRKQGNGKSRNGIRE